MEAYFCQQTVHTADKRPHFWHSVVISNFIYFHDGIIRSVPISWSCPDNHQIHSRIFHSMVSRENIDCDHGTALVSQNGRFGDRCTEFVGLVDKKEIRYLGRYFGWGLNEFA